MALAKKPDDQLDETTCFIEKLPDLERLKLILENVPAIISAIKDATLVAVAGYIGYQLANTPAFLGALTRVVEGLGEVFIEKVRAGSLEITLIAENQQTAETIRQFYKEGILLKQFNIALRKYGRDYNDPQRAFTNIVLTQAENAKVSRGNLASLRKKADKELSDACINGIKPKKTTRTKRRVQVEIDETTKTTKRTRILEEDSHYDLVPPFSSRDTHATSSCDSPTTSSRETTTLSQGTGKLTIADIELVTKNLQEGTTKNQKLNEPQQELENCIKSYKFYLEGTDFQNVCKIKKKMFYLLTNKYIISGGDLRAHALKLKRDGFYYDAILFYDMSCMFQSENNSVAKQIIYCVHGICKSLEALKANYKAAVKKIALDYVIPTMHDLQLSVKKIGSIEDVEPFLNSWCLLRIGFCYDLADEVDNSLLSYEKALKLMGETGQDSKNRLYGILLGSIGYAHFKKSGVYYNSAIPAITKAVNFKRVKEQEELKDQFGVFLDNIKSKAGNDFLN